MVEVLSRSGRAILSCHNNEEIPSQTAQVMLSVICTALNVLCHISQTATFALSSPETIGAASGLRVKSKECGSVMKAKDEQLFTLSICNVTFANEFSRETQVQAILGPSDLAAAQGSKAYTPEYFNFQYSKLIHDSQLGFYRYHMAFVSSSGTFLQPRTRPSPEGTNISLGRLYSLSVSIQCSLPYPLCFTPSNGVPRANRLKLLIKTIPTSICLAAFITFV